MSTLPLNRRAAAALAAVLIAGAAILVPALSASAHQGPITLSLSQDGTGRILAMATYVEDGHPVTAIIDPTLTAQQSNGEAVGPVPLVSAPEGEGIWITEDPVLTAGEWTVTVAVTLPEPAEVTESIDVAIVGDQVDPVSEQAASGSQTAILIGGAAVAALIAIGLIIAFVIARRRRASVR